MIGDDEYRTLNKKHKGTGKNGRKNSKIGLDYGIFEYSKLDQMDDTDIGDKSEESEFHPNPYMYVGYGAAHGDIMDSYIPQDLRNQRKNAGTFQSRNKFTTHLGFGTSNANNNNAKCISQCVFNNMDIVRISNHKMIKITNLITIYIDRRKRSSFRNVHGEMGGT